jgi:hypothetical protein
MPDLSPATKQRQLSGGIEVFEPQTRNAAKAESG